MNVRPLPRPIRIIRPMARLLTCLAITGCAALLWTSTIPPWFDIALVDTNGAALVIGNASRSYDLALTVAEEISEFTRIPTAVSRAPATASFQNVRTGNA